ncbi:MAG: hypothetical protein JWO36_6215 [Myxococcales bacterium]|nr:hypothetical protein [Myxococcales bacterium]
MSKNRFSQIRRLKGESVAAGNARASRGYREQALQLKKEQGLWKPAEQHERETGKRGRSD